MRGVGVICALALLFVPAASGIGWYAKWRGVPPLTLQVDTSGLDGYPAELPLVVAAMADWSLSPSVDLVGSVRRQKITIDTDMGACGAGSYGCSIPSFSRGVLHRVAIHVSAPLTFALGDGWTETVFCHELGHALGLLEVAGADDQGSCMRGDSPAPSQEDLGELAALYPL